MDDSTEEASTEVVSKPKLPQPPPQPPHNPGVPEKAHQNNPGIPENDVPMKEEQEEEEEEEEIPTLCPNTGMLLTAAGDCLPSTEEKKEKKPEIEEDEETVGEPLYEEDIIDGFSICSFKDYEDLEVGTPKIGHISVMTVQSLSDIVTSTL